MFTENCLNQCQILLKKASLSGLSQCVPALLITEILSIAVGVLVLKQKGHIMENCHFSQIIHKC